MATPRFVCSRLGPGCHFGATRPKRLALFSVGGAIVIAATVLRLPVTVSNSNDQLGHSCFVAQLCAQNFTGRSLGSQLLLPFCAGVVVP